MIKITRKQKSKPLFARRKNNYYTGNWKFATNINNYKLDTIFTVEKINKDTDDLYLKELDGIFDSNLFEIFEN